MLLLTFFITDIGKAFSMINQNTFYILKNDYFQKYDPKKHMMNNNSGNGRPFYLSIKSKKNEEIFWMIPISSKVQKYKKIYDAKIKTNKSVDILHFCDVSGVRKAILIQNMIPVSAKYIERAYTVSNVPLQLDGKNAKLIAKKANKIMNLHYRNIKFMPNCIDCKDIEEKLIAEIESEKIVALQPIEDSIK